VASKVNPRTIKAIERQKQKTKRPVSQSKKGTKIQGQAPRSERPQLIAFISVVVVLIVILAIVLISITTGGNSSTKTVQNSSVPVAGKLLSELTQIPASVYNQVQVSSNSTQPPQKISGPLLTSDGKPEVLYIGAEFCPYCAAERWILITALSRFGTFSGLKTWYSSSSDTPASIPTFTFLNASYSSKYITFVTKENEDENHNLLQPVTSQEQALWTKYSNGQLGYPFVDIANRFTTGAQYEPTLLSGLNQNTIARDINNPTSQVGQAIITGANYIDAAICSVLKNGPASVCNSPAVKAATSKLG
jgi:thiol-disulfide isomerase/thioredoxin